MNLLFFCSFNTVHLGAGLSFTPLHPVFIPARRREMINSHQSNM